MFLTSKEIEKDAAIEVDIDTLQSFCAACNLYKDCKSPMMEYSGEGEKGILIVGDTPSAADDQNAIQFSGESGRYLSELLSKNRVRMNRDCWKTNVVRCHNDIDTYKDYNKLNAKAKLCSGYLFKLLYTLKPKFVLILDEAAIAPLLGEDFDNREILRWRGFPFYDEKFDTTFFITFHPRSVKGGKFDAGKKVTFENDIAAACAASFKTQKLSTDQDKFVKQLMTCTEVLSVLDRILIDKKPIYIDFETSGLKPYRPGHFIATISMAVSPTEAYSFPFQFNNYWKSTDFQKIKEKVAQIFADPEIAKIVQNAKFEDCWAASKIGRIKGWRWDTMMSSHTLDNRSNFSGLKFQTFINFGVRPYDKHLEKYLRSAKGEEFNTVHKAPLKELLTYNGLDCIYGYMLYEKHKTIMANMKGLLHANTFLLKSSLTMSRIQQNGICMDEKYYSDQKDILSYKIKKIKRELMTGRESTKFREQFGRDLVISSGPDLGKLFFEVLGHPPVYTGKMNAKGVQNYKTDKDTLAKTGLPFAKRLDEMKRLTKARDTYLAQFARETYDGKMHPFFDLHVPVTYRSSCIAGYEKVLVMRNFESDPEGIPIKDIRQGDMIYCFDDDLNPQIRPVLWQGKTGHREIIRVHYYRKGGYGHFDCTPEHPVRLINGEYVEAQNLKRGDRTLAGARRGDKLNFTGHLSNGSGIQEHRFIYDRLIETVLGHNHYKLIELYNYYGIDSKRSWGNQFGKFTPGNHVITKVEFLGTKEDVYDIEVEDFHNFFVNEICVHNSSRPNFQNLPKRDEEIKNAVRAGIVPYNLTDVLSEIDFSGAEVICSVCVTGDTEIETIKGRVPIIQIIDQIKTRDIFVYGYCLNDKRIKIAQVTDGGITGVNKEVWKVTLDNGEVIKATPNHKFMIRKGSKGEGEYVELRHLKQGMSLMPFYKREKNGYVYVNLNNRKSIGEHTLIGKDVLGWDVGGSHSSNVVHHKDENGLNNDIENFEFMRRCDHTSHHHKGKVTGPHSEEHKNKISNSIKGVPCPQRAVAQTAEMRKRTSERFKGKEFSDIHKKRLSENKKEYWKTKPLTKCKVCGKSFKTLTNTHLIHAHNLTLEEYRIEYNHKVVSVDFCGYEDVYNINVEGIHNYAVSAGCIVKNCYHKDPTFLAYLKDKTTDMHRDLALQLWQLPDGFLSDPSYDRDQAKKAKKIRFYAKNNWTFAEFYGDWYDSCAKTLWENCISREKLVLPDGRTLEEHCRSVGIYTLEDFIEHCKGVEDDMWNSRFPVYTRWKNNVYKFYLKNGYIETFYGFRFIGPMDKKQCCNYPIQGTSFHNLLNVLDDVEKFIWKNKLKTKIVGQIHDSIILNIPQEEIQVTTLGVHRIIGDLHKKIPWLIVPMEAEISITKMKKNGGNMSSMREYSVEKILNKEFDI